MRIFLKTCVLFCIFCASAVGQDWAKKAEKNPLDCVLYLLKIENEFESRSEELKELSFAYWNSDRRSDALKTLEFIKNEDKETRVELYLLFAEDLIRQNNDREATQLLSSALKYVDNNEFEIGFDKLNKLAYYLSFIENEVGADQLIDAVKENYFKAEFLVTIADALQKKNQIEKALKLLPKALRFAEDSDFEKQKKHGIAAVARKYAELEKNEEALNLFEQVEEDAKSDRELFEVIFQSYLKLNLLKKAEELVKNQKNLNNSEASLKFAEISHKAGNKKNTISYLQKAEIFSDESFDTETKLYPYDFAENVINLFLKINEDALALAFAKKIKKTVPQQFSLLIIANYYLKQKQNNSAELVLNLAFEQVKDADENRFDFDGITITVGGEKLSKEWFLSAIANKFVEFKRFDRAINIINSIEIPYYRAGTLALYYLKQKNLKSKTKLLQNLANSNFLMETDNTSLKPGNKIIFWSKIAYIFNEFGDNNKSLETFTEILKKINSEESLRDDEKISSLITVGIWFEKSKIKADMKLEESFRKIIQKWTSNNE